MKNTLLLAFVFILVSCSDNSIAFKVGKKINSITPIEERTLEPTGTLFGSFLDGVWGINCIVDDSLAILSLRNADDFCFRALSLYDYRYLDFLAKGRGPGEVIAAFFSTKKTEKDRTFLDITAINERLLLSIDLNETLNEGYAIITETDELVYGSMFSFHVRDKILSEVVNDEDIYSMKIYEKDGEVVRIDQIYGDKEYLAAYQPLFNSTRMIKPDGSKLSLSMFYFDEINIYDIEGDNHLTISTSQRLNDGTTIKDAISHGRMGDHYYYLDQDVTDESIFALYYDCEVSESSERSSSTIHVFSWDGQLKAVYHIDEPLIDIAITDDESTLYGITAEEILYRYDL